LANPERPCLTIGILTDLHLGYDQAAADNVAAGVADLQELGIDVLAILGDVVNLEERHWDLARELILSRVRVPTIFTRGNADMEAGGDPAWLRVVGQPVRHALSLGGVRLVTAGAIDVEHRLGIGDDAPAWIGADLADHPDELGVVLCHAPVRDTTFWSCDNAEDRCLAAILPPANPPFPLFLRQSQAMAETLRRSPTARLFLTGHVHNDHRMVCDHGFGPWAEHDGVIHLATANLGGWQGFGIRRQEGRVVSITPERIDVRVRNVIRREFVPELDLSFPTRRP